MPIFAAVDIGSNSVRLKVARLVRRRLQTLHEDREVTRLGEAVFRGGLLGAIWGGWLHITYLWIDEAVRGKRWATKLMDQAEAYARERHCHSVELDTHSFQARPFYEKLGYETAATLDCDPPGVTRYLMTKRLV